MSASRAPRLEPRRFGDFEKELRERARAWIPAWDLADGERDFGQALLEIAARFSSEVAERLDGGGDKMARGFLDWLAVRGEAARPARMPVVFKLADTAREAVLAPHPVRMQVDARGTNVTFETEADVRLVSGSLDLVVGVDPTNDAFFLPPPGLSSLDPLEPLPTQWWLKSFAAPGSKVLQFDPGVGLKEGMLVEIEGAQYRISNPKDDLATIDPVVPAGDGFAADTPVIKVEAFYPFERARDQQDHVLYLGDLDLFNIEAQATIDVVGAQSLGSGMTWEYWGTAKDAPAADADPRWRSLTAEANQPDVLVKPSGAIEPRKVGAAEGRWIRARKAHLVGRRPLLTVDEIALRINAPPATDPPRTPIPATLPAIDVIVNTTPTVPEDFYPFGREPRLFDTFYLGCAEAFSKQGARASVEFAVQRDGRDRASVPQERVLSWEYWNGTGWWRLELDGARKDENLDLHNLMKDGAITFTVPTNLKPVECAGRTNHWIRARLTDGDYGRETVTVIGQTVVRSTNDINQPQLQYVRVSYSVDKAILPTFLLTQDSGTLRDQSDANRTPGALIEVFTPLIHTLQRFEAPVAAASTTVGEECVPDCECPSGTTSTSPTKKMSTAAASVPPSPTLASRAESRALYLGFDSKLSGEPINVLFVAEDRSHDALAPLAVDALVGDHFVPVVAKDDTRALGETGLVSMSFSVEPKPGELFGRSLSWLRLTPRSATIEWKPALRAAYLNAVWARAAETMTRELVGSSIGAPNLSLPLARPPLLKDSLELRVKEPLGEQERKDLLGGDPDSVKSKEVDLPGDWVLWTQVADPLDREAAARVYSLDEDTGIIRFGDGLHGAIPPIGADAIVAFEYERTESATRDGVPANFVSARAPLNLVTPVESVEEAIAADQAAGGVAPDSAERVLHFGAARLRHRARAVTARDFEDLALERSADVVQARCFVRSGRVRLVVVMRGKDPKPSQAQRRELKRMLLGAAPAGLAAAALSINGPTVRRLRIRLTLRVATLDVAGELANRVKKILLCYFDTDSGGERGDEWALGVSPREDDIAEMLLDTPDLENIAAITLAEINADGGERPWPDTIGAGELTMLADDGIRIGFEIVEAVA